MSGAGPDERLAAIRQTFASGGFGRLRESDYVSVEPTIHCLLAEIDARRAECDTLTGALAEAERARAADAGVVEAADALMTYHVSARAFAGQTWPYPGPLKRLRSALDARRAATTTEEGGRCAVLTQRPNGPHLRLWPDGRIDLWSDGKPGAKQEDADGAGADGTGTRAGR